MAHYTRFWDCELCGRRQESIDWPRIEVCDDCMDARGLISRTVTDYMSLRALAEAAYTRGYRAGRKVAGDSPRDVP